MANAPTKNAPAATDVKTKAAAKPVISNVKAAAPTAEKAVAKKVETNAAPKVAAKPAVTKAAPKKVVAKATAKKTVAPAKKRAPVKAKTVRKVAKTAAAKTQTKQTTVKKGINTMTKTAEKITETAKSNFEAATARVQDFYGDLNGRTKAAYEKGVELAGKTGEFHKANFEAALESGKIAAKGAQDMGQDYVAVSRSNIEATTAHVKELVAVKTPTDFFSLQTSFARNSFNAFVKQATKNNEAMVKLAGEVAQPISNRAAAVMETYKTAA